MTKPDQHTTIIVAGGRGVRMGAEVPKQFLLLAGRPLLMYSIRAFREAYPDMKIIVVLPADQRHVWMELCAIYRFEEDHVTISGGPTRFQSVKNGLAAATGNGLVAIHDGVRPLIRPETIRRLFEEAASHSNAIPVIAPSESLRWQDGNGNRIINRDFVKIIQTPQVFELHKLKAAYVFEENDKFTDDASVWEAAGHPVHLCPGQVGNIKVTTREDLRIAEALLPPG